MFPEQMLPSWLAAYPHHVRRRRRQRQTTYKRFLQPAITNLIPLSFKFLSFFSLLSSSSSSKKSFKMVSHTQILSTLSHLTSSPSKLPRVSLFIGATNGIGKTTLKALITASAPSQSPIRIYLTCRSSSLQTTQTFISSELKPLNPKAEIIILQGEISLLSEVRRISASISSKETGIDLLFLTAGYAPFGGGKTRKETGEGLEVAQSLEYYSRILFIRELLPLLKQYKGRVISVLGGGLEKPFSISDVNDLELREKGSGFLGYKAQTQYVAMNTLGMEVLARENRDITFLHSWPGIVSTGNVWRGLDDRRSWLGWFIWLVVEPLIKFFGTSEEDCGQRFLFQCCSGLYGGEEERVVEWEGEKGKSTEGGGLFLVNYKCQCTPNENNLKVLREKAQEKVWEHTLEVFQRTEEVQATGDGTPS
ncbi:oxidoreductase andH [Podospora fimiseda]|uniref:Oxidoreductase andH n=1 Tax=Podospora fimiseda TaxID=252190 RepID=A0AAN7BT03_9PEZI|nr:oxidoreductase andH [Podospora fimiseda]